MSRLKWYVLALYVCLDTLLLLTLRWAAESTDPSISVISSTEVLFSEVIKLLISLALCFIYDAKLNLSEFQIILTRTINDDSSDLVKLTMPSILYIIQNNLQYIIETRVVFLVMYQCKIITTALFYSNMLSRRINTREWGAIIALTLGVSLVESCQADIGGHYHASYPFGIISVLIAIVTSGFAGVYFEKILKASKSSIWVINVQLSGLSCVFGMVACLTQNTQEIDKNGFFSGYNAYTVCVIALQASVGLLVALSVKHSDNIHKNFAASVSVMLSGIVGIAVFQDIQFDQSFLTGAFIVLLTTVAFVTMSERNNQNHNNNNGNSLLIDGNNSNSNINNSSNSNNSGHDATGASSGGVTTATTTTGAVSTIGQYVVSSGASLHLSILPPKKPADHVV